MLLKPPPVNPINKYFAIKNGRYELRPSKGLRLEMERKEQNRIKNRDREMGNTSQEVGEKGIRDSGMGSDEDAEDGMSFPGEDLAGNESLATYKRLQSGDLCELRASSGNVEMGVYLKETEGKNTGDFLTPHGMIKAMFPARVTFHVSGFVKKEEVNAILNSCHKAEDPHGESLVVDYAVSGPILAPVKQFQRKAHELLSQNIIEFDTMYDFYAHDTETKRITTKEAAQRAFSKTDPSMEEQYAAHLALLGDGVRFLGDKGFHRITQRFRVRSRKELEMVDDVTEWIRKSTMVLDEKATSIQAVGPVKDFIKKARKLISMSRVLRQQKPKSGASVERLPQKDIQWTDKDRRFIDYMAARMKSYGLQKTPIEGLVPFILRQTNKYPGRDLDANCVYDFLVEIGAFSPWENTALHQDNQELPGYGRTKQVDLEEARLASLKPEMSLKEHGLKDSLASLRKDWGKLTIYCIDDANAEEIDDGVSIERINDNEVWIHSHIANPTAFLTPDHWIAKIAKTKATTKYFDPHVFPMLPKALSSALGVQNGAPVLTFSTKINRDGEVLDYNIQPGTVHNVQRITYNQLGRIIGAKPVEKRTIGTVPGCYLNSPDVDVPLSQSSIDDLLLMNKYSRFLRRRRVKDGMISLRNIMYEYRAAPEARTLFSPSDLHSTTPILFKGFPEISLHVEKSRPEIGAQDCVAEYMILANSILAKFSQKHDIPMPYRTLSYNSDRQDVIRNFETNIMPLRDIDGQTSGESILKDLPTFLCIGFSQTRVQPGPHRLMGLHEGYIKATSPLRRFSDMIAHWNLQSYLLSPTNPNPFPFPGTYLTSSIIPELDIRERMASFGNAETRRFWAAACIHRVLSSGDPQNQLPKTMTMVITEQREWPTPSVGFVTELALFGKVMFENRAQFDSVNKNDIISVGVVEAKLSDRLVIFEYRHLLEKSKV